MSRVRLARTNANDQLTDYVPLDAESDQLAGEPPTGIADSPSTLHLLLKLGPTPQGVLTSQPLELSTCLKG